MHLSKEYLSSLFHKETGMPLPTYLARQKVNSARELPTYTNMSKYVYR